MSNSIASVSSAPTLFAVVATYQVWENYFSDVPADGRWKAKGGHEVVVHEGLTLEQTQMLAGGALDAMVRVSAPESDEYMHYDLIAWELVSLDANLIREVTSLIENCDGDLGYARYCCEYGEFAFDWVCRRDPSLLSPYANEWGAPDIMRIMGLTYPNMVACSA